jgi:MinD superfamily P-loop ATPase
MKQIALISGKGGTGKTVIAGAFAALMQNNVLVDSDVDAADLHLLVEPVIEEENEFRCGFTASLDTSTCIQCGRCIDVCRFDAIEDSLTIDPFSCVGCGFCRIVCPNGSIEMRENISGKWFVSGTRFGPLVHAQLDPAEENSGKLVTLLRRKALEIMETQSLEWIIIDGPPGIGCPVIASLSGVNCALIIAEPTISGLHDADRVIQITRQFKVDTKLVINKFDLNPDVTKKIEEYCHVNNIPVLGKIKFDEDIVKATLEAKTLVEYRDGEAKRVVASIWEKLKKTLQ